MTKLEQINFVNELCNNVKNQIVFDIRKDKIPGEWEGMELRQYIADKFSESTIKMSLDRKREYNNTVLVNNL